MPRIHFGTCPLCEACCGIRVTLDGDRVTDIRGDDDHPLSQGYVCPKAAALADLHSDPNRLKRPLRRTGSTWEEVDWDQAIAEVSGRLRDIRRAHGNDAVAAYQGNPTVHSLGALTFGTAFFQLLKTKNLYAATSVDQLPHMLSSLLMFGDQLLLPIPDVDRTDLFVIFGANPLVSNGSIMTAPDMRGRLRALRERGGRVVVFDPRRTETAAAADEHHFIRPSSDALVLASILHVLDRDGRIRFARLAHLIEGADVLARLFKVFAPERVAEATGVAASVIETLAAELATTPRAVVYGRMGASTQAFGGLCSWLINLVNLATGHFDEVGGAMFARPAIDLGRVADLLGYRGGFARYHSRVRGLPEFCGEYPVATLADEIATPGPGKIRALITSAGNPVLSTPEGSRLGDALGALEFMVSIDPYLNETTRHADYILPPTGPLERSHYDLVFLGFAVRNFAHFSQAAIPRGPDQRHDWEIFAALATEMHLGSLAGALAGGNGLVGRALRALITPERLVDIGLRTGPYGGLRPGKTNLSVASLRDAPHGIDLGPLGSRLPSALRTPNQHIHLLPAPYLEDLARLEQSLHSTAPNMTLIGRRNLRSNNSWMHNSARLVKGKPQCTALLNPTDASARGIENGDLVRIRSRVGQIELPAELTADIMPGVVSVPHGWGHGRTGTELDIANAHPGVSINDLTDTQFVDPLSGTAALSGVAVEIEAAGAGDRKM